MLLSFQFSFAQNVIYIDLGDNSKTERKKTEEQFIVGLEIPKTKEGVSEQLIEHIGYVTSYNSEHLIPNWVSYELTALEVKGSIRRPSGKQFEPDPLVIGNTAIHSDYTRQRPWVRGHMAPAADMKWSIQSMNESFYLSNVIPQDSSLNDGVWERLENKVRSLATRYGAVYVCTGTVVGNNPTKIGMNKVAVPSKLFKVLCIKINNDWQTIGFLFPNAPCSGSMFDYAVPVNDIEKLTGHDFFYKLPDDIEEIIEQDCDIRKWQ